MTQPQAQQQRLGQHPEFHAFLESLANIPEDQHEKAWEDVYGRLLREDRQSG